MNDDEGIPDLRLKPFLKWAGGKRWLLSELRELIPSSFNSYYEPFLGGGAVFFGLNPAKAILSDLNKDLIELYQMVRNRPDDLLAKLSDHHINHSKDHYYETRSLFPIDPIERAARMLYLNRTCFNGLYRVNKRGEFNVPIGTKSKVVFEDESFARLSNSLMRADLFAQDFQVTLREAGKGDFVYVDPPYTVAHNFNGFLKYNDNIFSWDDQVRLRNLLEDAAIRGANIVVSNANHKSIRDLYQGFGKLKELPRYSVIAGPSNRRVPTSELLFSICAK